MKRVKNYTKEEVTQPQFKVFNEHCRMLLNEMHASLMGFDWTSFCQMNVKIFQVWNGINLFLRQGMFLDDVYPPVRNIKYVDISLESFSA